MITMDVFVFPQMLFSVVLTELAPNESRNKNMKQKKNFDSKYLLSKKFFNKHQ